MPLTAPRVRVYTRGSVKLSSAVLFIISAWAAWNAGVFSLIRQLSETVILPIAGLVLTFVATYELIQMLLEKNNMHEFDVANIYKWIFKTACAIFILSNTFNIVMAVFDVSQTVIAQAGGLIQGSTDITPDMMAELETTLEGMDLGPVSYTHLDVYKRQAPNHTGDATLPLRWLPPATLLWTCHLGTPCLLYTSEDD